MCGIAGHVLVDKAPEIERLRRACDVMAHRGPDDGGVWVERNVALAHRRLSILDLSPAGRQPMVADDDSAVVTFNGEIYNYRELRDELVGRYPFRSSTDTEVLLNGYRAWGWQGLLQRIEGMFAFALWDKRTETLHAARDRLGKKPFFYRRRHDGLAFASTLEAVLQLLDATPAVNPRAVDAFLTYQAVPAPLTIYEGVEQLRPAHCLTYDARTAQLRVERYWDVSFAAKDTRRSESETLDQLDSILRSAVRKRLVSDVPLGAFLSGGVDSSLVVALMAQESQSKVTAICVGFEEQAFDERRYARRVAAHCGVELHEHVVRPQVATHLPAIVWQYGQPVADESIVPTYFLAQATRRHVTVALNGDGGDEVFGGYSRPLIARAAARYRQFVPAGVRRLLGTYVDGRKRDRFRKARLLIAAGKGDAAEAFRYDRGFGGHLRQCYAPALARSLDGASAEDWYRAVWNHAAGSDDVDRALYGDLVTYLPDQLLVKMDVSTMAHSLEARSPLLDPKLIEFAATVPTALRLKGYVTKYLLKRLAERYVPRDVLYRPKRGFVIPLQQWLTGEMGEYVSAALLSPRFREREWLCQAAVARLLDEHRSGARDWSQPIWTAFVLELWARMAIDKSLQPADSLETVLA